jgi:hypothetical protein
MGSHSYRERHALQLHRQINEDRYRDPFDADYDPGDVPAEVVARDDVSYRPAVPPELPQIDVETARQRVKSLLAVCRKPAPRSRAVEALKSITCWKDTPELYRRMVVAASGLSADVVAKKDRDLTEQEKVMLRSAISDLRLVLSGLVAL